MEHQCYVANTFLELDCECDERVISILWADTVFGASNCGSPNCCPGPDDCLIPVSEQGFHREELNECNGECTCRVQVSWIFEGCAVDSGGTDYENVTYECVPPPTTTPPTGPPTTENSSERDTTVSEVITVTQRTTPHDEGNDCDIFYRI